MPVLEVSRDFAELEKTALALFEWSAKLDAMPEQLKHHVHEPEVSDVHRGWLEYLFRYESACADREAQISMRADIAGGLAAIKRARRAFERKHKRCRCGRWSPALAKICICGKKFE